MNDKRLFLLDAYALIFRAYYAMIRNPRFTRSGINTSAVFGFVNTLQDLLKREQPSHIAVCFDPGGKTFRHECYDRYKANRDETPEGVKEAVPYIKRILEAYHIPSYQVAGFEADDVMGTMSRLAAEKGFDTYMVTGDKDMNQLVGEHVKIYHPGKNEILGVEEVKAKYGISSPLQVIDLLGLMGDSSDNIPGCPGVGEKTAAKLLQQFGSIENLLNNTHQLKGAIKQNVENNAKKIQFSKFLATIRTDVPLEWNEDEMRRVPVDYNALGKVFDELEFRVFAKRIIEQNEGNVGLDVPNVVPPTVPAEAQKPIQKPAPATQLSLFDTDEPQVAPQEEPTNEAETAGIKTALADSRLLVDVEETAALVQEALKQPRVAVVLVSEGEEAMRAQILGFAVAVAPNQPAAYISMDGFGLLLDAVRPLFSGKTTILSPDVKRDMVILKNHGVDFTAPYFDTGVAHYLLQPERSHSTEAMAQELLNYQTIPAEEYMGVSGRVKKKLHEVPAETLKEPMCELAALQHLLYNQLNESKLPKPLGKLLTEVELPLVRVLASMELTGVRIDVKALTDFSVSLTSRMNQLEQECFDLAGMHFNTSSPAQVGEVLFERLKLDPRAKKTRRGQYSTTEEILVKLRDRHPLVDKILELRGIRKLLSTYVDALPKLINPRTARVHTTYNQTVTATGRLSSTSPNMQNIPVRDDLGREIRKAFIPATGNVFFSADYSQIELRLVADLSGDETMIHAFAADADIHAITASKIYHKPLDEVTSEERRRAKTANFGILYGISAFGLSQRLNIPRKEAQMLIDGYFETFPRVRDYIDTSVAKAKETGYVTTLLGRRRMLPDINSRNAVVRQFSERNAVNAPIQGTAADVIKMAMVAIFNRFEQEKLRSKMILQVHDELNFDVVPEELERVEEIVIAEMERAYSGRVRLTASHAHATNWLDAH